MQVPATERRSVQVGPFVVDFLSHELRNHHRKIPLQEKPFQVLAILLDRPGELVTREALREKLWPADTFVDFEHSINTAVRKLRDALEDHAEEPHFIETVPRLGYRLIASVTETPTVEVRPLRLKNGEEPPEVTRETSSARRRRGRRLLLAGTAVVVVGIILFGLNVGGVRERLWRQRPTEGATPIRVESLAVLPFENLSGDSSKDYFADGFTDELITDLAEQTRIRIVSRSSVMRYKGSRKPLPEIARELNVDAIVEGSISLSDQKVRITAQLIQAAPDRHLWAHSYERGRKDLFSIQRELAAAVAHLIRTKADGLDSANVGSVSSTRFTAATYELFLECRALRMTGREEGINQAIRCYQHILALDPNSAAAYAELAQCYLMLSDPRARALAIKATELDTSLPEAHLALADVKVMQENDLPAAEREFGWAMALNPSYAQAHVDHIFTLVGTGRVAEAIAEGRTARELDPFSAANAVFYGRILFMAGQYDKAITEEAAALELDPRRDRAHYWIGYSYEQKGMYREAIAEYEKAMPNDDHGIFLAAIGRSFALSGDSKQAAEVKRKIEHYSEKDFMWPYDAALFYAALGDKDRAFKWLDKEEKHPGNWLMFLKVDPRLSTLRSDARFRELLQRTDLPQ